MTTYDIQLTNHKKQILHLHLPSWKKLKNGAAHLVLQNPQETFVLSIPLRTSEPQIHPLECIYQNILSTSQLTQFLNVQEKYHPSEESQNTLKKYFEAQPDFPTVQMPLKAMFKSEKIKIRKEQWDCALQFKVKCPLPERFNAIHIENQNIQQIKLRFEKLDKIERTRWWAKAGFTSRSKHINPISLFQLKSSLNFVPFISAVSSSMAATLQTNQQKEDFNRRILKLLEESQMMSQIYKLQNLCTVNPQYLIQSANQILQGAHLSQTVLQSVTRSIIDSLNTKETDSVSELIEKSFQKSSICSDVLENDTVQNVLRFLISLVWKDISIIMRISQKGDMQLRIIDYHLKPLRKIRDDVKKRKNLFKGWIEWMQKIEMSDEEQYTRANSLQYMKEKNKYNQKVIKKIPNQVDKIKQNLLFVADMY